MFVKISATTRLAHWSLDGPISKTAAMDKTASHFADPANTQKLDVGAVLAKVAKEYDISSNPRDYIFEAVRAVTAGVANENGDAFSKNELLRYDHAIGKPVYQTFQYKPHHVNHRTDNPKTARGVILDAHYNDSTPALEICPREGCGNRTAEREGRDSTGLYCRKCGATAKDEFVEICIGIDASKDPAFADGVRTGSLNATSMGCFIPGTLVTMADGTRKNIELIVPGDRVITHTGAVTEVDEPSEHPCSGEIVEIKVSGVPADIQATQDHPFWVVNPETGVGTWTQAAYVNIGDYLLSPRMAAETPVAVEYELARLAGWFAAEGNFIKAYDGPKTGEIVGLEFSLGSEERKHADEIAGLLSKLGCDPSIYERKARNLIVVKAYRCQALAAKMFELVGQHAHNKSLSPDILRWPAERQLAFIGAFIDGDGYVINDEKHKWTAFSVVSHDLVAQMSQMLTNLNIPHRTAIAPKRSGFGSERPAYDLYITGGENQLKLANVSSKVASAGIVPSIHKMRKNHLPSEAGILRKVTGVSLIPYDGKVYNFSVKHADHSYVAGGISVHNCNCQSTTCNVCDHVAYNRNEFCTHIRSGNKKKTFKTASGDKVAFEWCNDVVFTEQSRVDQPADPKALQQEILQLVAQRDTIANRADLKSETELLLLTAKINDLSRRVAQMAQPPPGGVAPPQAPPVPQQDMTVAGRPSIADFNQKMEQTEDNAEPQTMDEAGVVPSNGEGGGSVPTDMGGKAAGSITKQDVIASINQGIVDELDSIADGYANNFDKGDAMSFKFKNAYINLHAAITEQGNCRVFANEDDTLFVVKASEKLTDQESRVAFGTEILQHIANHGLVPTMKSYNTLKSPKLANILEHYVSDFGDRETGDTEGITENRIVDKDKARTKLPGSLQDDQMVDHQEPRDERGLKDSLLDTVEVDHEEGRHDPESSVLDEEEGDHAHEMKMRHKNITEGENGPGIHDHQMKTGAKDDDMEDSDEESKSDSKSGPPSKKDPPSSKKKKDGPSKKGPPSSKGSKPKKGVNPFAAGESTDPMAAPPGDQGATPMPPAGPMTGQGATGQDCGQLIEQAKALAVGNPQLEALLAELETQVCPPAEDPIAADPMGAPPMEDPMAGGAPPMGMMAKKDGSKWKKPWTKNHATETGEESASKAKTSKSGAVEKIAALEGKLERLYKGRFAKLKEESQKQIADAHNIVAGKFMRAFKLAAARQQLNLEESPLKVAFSDALMQPMNLGNDEMFPGIDPELTVMLIEKGASAGFGEFVEKTAARATELTKLSADAFNALEADVKNLQPVIPHIASSQSEDDRLEKRQAALRGNPHIAPAASEDAHVRTAGRVDRDALRASLGGTTVGMHNQRMGR